MLQRRPKMLLLRVTIVGIMRQKQCPVFLRLLRDIGIARLRHYLVAVGNACQRQCLLLLDGGSPCRVGYSPSKVQPVGGKCWRLDPAGTRPSSLRVTAC